jgi:hypothetical protein
MVTNSSNRNQSRKCSLRNRKLKGVKEVAQILWFKLLNYLKLRQVIAKHEL